MNLVRILHEVSLSTSAEIGIFVGYAPRHIDLVTRAVIVLMFVEILTVLQPFFVLNVGTLVTYRLDQFAQTTPISTAL